MFQIIQYFTFSVAMLGAVLGIINTWKSSDRDKIKLKVIPKHAIPVGSADPSIICAIEVINLSSFAITLSEVGFLLKGTKARISSINLLLAEGGSLPKRLESRTAVTAYFTASDLVSNHYKIRCAYAWTASGEKFKGNTPALRQISRKLIT